jgi:hypothetical protein
MKYLILLSSLVLTFVISGCGVEESIPDCERSETSEFCFKNSTSDPINIFVDEDFQFKLSTGASRCKSFSAGAHSYKAEQAEGFILFPDVWQGTEDLIMCDRKSKNIIR